MKRGRSKSAPKYRLHKRSGQAVVSINGKDIYLGKQAPRKANSATGPLSPITGHRQPKHPILLKTLGI